MRNPRRTGTPDRRREEETFRRKSRSELYDGDLYSEEYDNKRAYEERNYWPNETGHGYRRRRRTGSLSNFFRPDPYQWNTFRDDELEDYDNNIYHHDGEEENQLFDLKGNAYLRRRTNYEEEQPRRNEWKPNRSYGNRDINRRQKKNISEYTSYRHRYNY